MINTPMKYLDKAMNTVRDLGLLPADSDSRNEPIVALLNQITTIDEDRVVAIARTLSQASLFNEIVREQIKALDISDRYESITKSFNSIRDDARLHRLQRIDTCYG